MVTGFDSRLVIQSGRIDPHSPMIVMPKPHQKPSRAVVRESLERDRAKMLAEIDALCVAVSNINLYLAAQSNTP